MQNMGGGVCFGRRGTPRGGHARRGNAGQPSEQRLNIRYTRLDCRGLSARRGGCPPAKPTAGPPHRRVHWGRGPVRSGAPYTALGPAPARADGKNCEIAALTLYTPYSPSASVLARDTWPKGSRERFERVRICKNAVTEAHFLKSGGRARDMRSHSPMPSTWGAALSVAMATITGTYDAAPCVTNDVPKCRAWCGGLWPKAWP